MATIAPRRQANGTLRYTAIVRIRKGSQIIHRESKTFSHRGAILAKQGDVSLKSLVRWYIDNFGSISKWQRSKQSQLEFLERHPIGNSNAFELTTTSLVDHIRSRRSEGAGPATVSNDLTWIGVVFRAAKSVKGLALPSSIVDEARTACRELRLIRKSRRRDRRPTTAELEKLDQLFSRRDRRAEIPMRDIMWFAIHTGRRESEICRLAWADNDDVSRIGWVRDAKHPTAKEGNDRQFKYTPEAWDIVQRQPRGSEFIFPYDPKSVCAAFTRAHQLLGILDLRFHDLRHEATSRLFERGLPDSRGGTVHAARIMERTEAIHPTEAREGA